MKNFVFISKTLILLQNNALHYPLIKAKDIGLIRPIGLIKTRKNIMTLCSGTNKAG